MTPKPSTTHWDCECETRYIHPNVHAFCPTCGAKRDEQPNAHQEEVADYNKHWRPREEPPYETVESTVERLDGYVRILREALSGVLDSSEDGGDMNDIDWSGIRAALEATKEGD